MQQHLRGTAQGVVGKHSVLAVYCVGTEHREADGDVLADHLAASDGDAHGFGDEPRHAFTVRAGSTQEPADDAPLS